MAASIFLSPLGLGKSRHVNFSCLGGLRFVLFIVSERKASVLQLSEELEKEQER